jgi:hypothetical protein
MGEKRDEKGVSGEKKKLGKECNEAEKEGKGMTRERNGVVL